MHRTNVIINPAIMFFLYLYPFDFKIKPKMIDAIGMGVIMKQPHIFSTKRPFASDIIPTKASAPKIDANEPQNSRWEVSAHLFEIGTSTVFDGFLYIYE